MAALEKWQRYFEHASLAGIEFKLPAALRCGADRQAPFLARPGLVLPPDDNPNPALWAGDAEQIMRLAIEKIMRPSEHSSGTHLKAS